MRIMMLLFLVAQSMVFAANLDCVLNLDNDNDLNDIGELKEPSETDGVVLAKGKYAAVAAYNEKENGDLDAKEVNLMLFSNPKELKVKENPEDLEKLIPLAWTIQTDFTKQGLLVSFHNDHQINLVCQPAEKK